MTELATRDTTRLAAELLREAAVTGVPCDPVRDLLGSATMADAYAVQRLNTEHSLALGRRLAGWKIGLTSPAVRRQFGIDQPDFGAVFADTEVFDGAEIPGDELIQPKVEAEIALVLSADLTDPPITPVDVIKATAFVLPAIEIVDSRIRHWDISVVDTIADNASTGRYVVGGTPRRLDQVDLRGVTMTMTDGHQVISEGTGAACFESPLNAVAWLGTTLATLDRPLRAGDVVLSGALGPMVTVERGTTYEATLPGVGSVRAAFAPYRS
jgi:2-keto-4-pentenoate hydratase